jgi:hypothetical protein
MENTNPQIHRERKVVKVSRKKIATIIILIIAIFLAWRFLARPFMRNTTGIGAGGTTSVNSMPGREGGNDAAMPEMPQMDYGSYGEKYPYMPYPQNDPSYKDTREFLKTNYNAQINTRDVSDIVRDVKGAVRDAEGRVDGTSSSEEYGYVSFVVPKSKFDGFKDEIESLVHEKLIVVAETSTNLLGQKQSIEARGEEISLSLVTLERTKLALAEKHKQILASIEADLKLYQNTLTERQAQIAAETDEMQKSIQINSLGPINLQIATLQQKKKTENSSYTTQLKNIEDQITAQKLNEDNNVKQDEQFTDNVETVNGYINVNRVTLWEMAKIFSPVHPTVVVIVILLVLWYWLSKKGYVPKFVLV